MKYLNKEQWVELFEEAGATESMMKKWHAVFEKHYPEVHQAFLEHLQIPADEIQKIRNMG